MSLKRTSAVGWGRELETTIFDQVEHATSSERFAMWWAASLWRSASSLGSISSNLVAAAEEFNLSFDRTSEMGSDSGTLFGCMVGFGAGVEGGRGVRGVKGSSLGWGDLLAGFVWSARSFVLPSSFGERAM